MNQIPIDECSAGPEIDAAVAEAAEYIEVPFASGKKTPPELEDIPITEKRYVYVLVWNDESEFQRGVWRRRHGGGDFFLWQPSTDIRSAWELAINSPESDDHVAIYLLSVSRNITLDWWARFGEQPGAIGDTAPLAITRAYLKAKGVEWVEVPD